MTCSAIVAESGSEASIESAASTVVECVESELLIVESASAESDALSVIVTSLDGVEEPHADNVNMVDSNSEISIFFI